jgi:hypothetical protein
MGGGVQAFVSNRSMGRRKRLQETFHLWLVPVAPRFFKSLNNAVDQQRIGKYRTLSGGIHGGLNAYGDGDHERSEQPAKVQAMAEL